VVILWGGEEKTTFQKNKDKDINLSQMMMIIILLNFSNDLVQKFFGKMPYCIDSLLGFSLYNEKIYMP
jgi:hypothetical protein